MKQHKPDSRFAEGMHLHGSMEAVLVCANGDVRVTRKDNIIVDVGFDFVCDCLGKAAGRPDVLSHIAVGNGTGAAAAAQTALLGELGREPAVYAHAAGTKVFTMTASFGAGTATGAITEAGVLNAGADGALLDRVVFAVINKGVEDSLTVTFTFTLS